MTLRPRRFLKQNLEQNIRFCSTSDGVRLAYATTGKGFPLVRAAHYLSHLDFDRDSPVWRHWIRELSSYNLYVRYDERGCGLSDWEVANFSFEAWVKDLETVVDSLGLEKFILFGPSQGGPVSIAYAVRHPDRVKQLVLYNTYALGWAKREHSTKETEVRQTMHRLMELGWGKDESTFRQMYTTHFVPDASLEQMRWFNDLQRTCCPPENAVRFDEEFGRIDVLNLLPKVSVPTLIVHSMSDQVVPFANGKQLATMIPNARFVPLQGRNHILLEDEPAWSRFLQELRAFTQVRSDLPPVEIKTPAGERQSTLLIQSFRSVDLSRFRVAGDYLRYDEKARNSLKDLRLRMTNGLLLPSAGHENYLIWGPPGTGKTYFLRQLAASLGEVEYTELNLSQLEESGFRSRLAEIDSVGRPCLCLVDEIDSHPVDSWPYEILLTALEPSTSIQKPRTFVLTGSSTSSMAEMKQRIASRPKGPDLLSRIRAENESEIPPLETGDKIIIALQHFMKAAKDGKRNVNEVEKLALLYIVLSPRLISARQLREFSVRCVDRLPPGEDRIKYDHLFDPGDTENKQFWLRTMSMHTNLISTFVSFS